MPVELRKRKEAPPAPVREAKKKAPAKAKKADSEKTVVEKVQETVVEAVETVKEAVTGKTNGEASKPTVTAGGIPKTGDTIDLSSFGGEVETNDGTKTTLAKLVEESKGGVVLFTYLLLPLNNQTLLTLCNCRHQASLPLPRLLRAPYRDRLQHLRSLQ
jgi:peroxiredoxin Q/BCP